VVAFDNVGVGATTGATPNSVEAMVAELIEKAAASRGAPAAR
jgi:hypothetical protein